MGAIFLLLILIGAYWQITSSTQSKILAHSAPLPTSHVALLLGCPSKLADGRANLFYEYRLDATLRLFQSGQITQIIVSDHYPEVMRHDLIARGIPEQVLINDPQGISTLASIRSYKNIYPSATEPLILISQADHLSRALYMANHYGIEAFGYPAKDVTGPRSWKTLIRESLARVKALLNLHVLEA